jgi:hypothetical protein
VSDRSIDTLAREASGAARRAVAPVVLASTPVSPRGGRSPGVRFVFAGLVLCLATGLIAFGALRPSGTTVSTGPASESSESTLPPPPIGLPPHTGSFETPITSGQMSDGKTWSLFIGGPANDLCLGIAVDPVIRSDVCGGGPGPNPTTDPDPYRPHLHSDSRVVPTVFGRIAADVVMVAVVGANGRSTGPVPVITATGGPYYRVEVPGVPRPLIIIGYRADGSSIRYSLPA